MHYPLNSADQVANEGKAEFEDNLMDMIDNGNFEEIEENLTPEAFQKCESNYLQMGMKVSISCNFYCLITKMMQFSREQINNVLHLTRKYAQISPSFNWGIFSHVMRLDQ